MAGGTNHSPRNSGRWNSGKCSNCKQVFTHLCSPQQQTNPPQGNTTPALAQPDRTLGRRQRHLIHRSTHGCPHATYPAHPPTYAFLQVESNHITCVRSVRRARWNCLFILDLCTCSLTVDHNPINEPASLTEAFLPRLVELQVYWDEDGRRVDPCFPSKLESPSVLSFGTSSASQASGRTCSVLVGG